MISPKFFCVALALLGSVRAEDEVVDRSVVHNSHAATSAAATRQVELYNNCGYEVQYKWTSGFNTPANAFFPIPSPGPNGYKLKTQERYTATFVNNWSGNIGACQGASCETGSACTGGCGVANAGPMTRAEWTFVPDGTDFYDITVINGVNIPMKMEPIGASYNTNDPYKCGIPGRIESVTSGSGCSWDYAKFQSDFHYNAVAGGSGKACSSASGCSGGEVCGYKFVPGVGLGMFCGVRYGFYTANQVCALDNGNSYFKCDQSAGDATGLKVRDMYGCVGPWYLSGYQPASVGQDGKVCGCTDWADRGVGVLPTPQTEKCKVKNPKWLEKIAPNLDFLKKACPTTYTYPYDDMTSTFVCPGEKKFRITFCPSGTTSTTPTPTTGPTPTPQPTQTPAPTPGPGGKYVYIGTSPDKDAMTQWCNWNCPAFCPPDMCRLA
ncbi:hypothetical protein Poli38472_014860 [Pythium oligandrum]|uniref:Osmotin, thaumatin-like protein n=1 Tax=Pythium oligandrum TaxID=41045 RepID=A0A8K1FGD1_PYTOL|nr:hypothetical protein Poli38472_014860 [Pythium oligandrum]|eukprot:TMW57673.1 hypothetical protein Poli38472_014860 [Pythium oligandrum]